MSATPFPEMLYVAVGVSDGSLMLAKRPDYLGPGDVAVYQLVAVKQLVMRLEDKGGGGTP